MGCGAVCLRGAIVDDQPRLAGKYLIAMFKILWAFGGCPTEERQHIGALSSL